MEYLIAIVSNPKTPFASIVGGLQLSTKIGVLESLLAKVDILILGGGMVFTFIKAQGYYIESSLVKEKFSLATSLINYTMIKDVALLLPADVVADKFALDSKSKVCFSLWLPLSWYTN